MNNPLHVRSLFARPSSETRIALQLPSEWPPLLNCIKTGEEVVFEEWTPNNSAREQFTERNTRIGAILAHPFLEEIVRALRSDVQVWSLDGTDAKVRWVAEQLVLKVYDIEADLSRQTFPISSDFVNFNYNQSRKLRNEFFDLVEEFDEGVRVSSIQNSLNPNKTLDFWIALYAFSSFRFHLIDLIDAFKIAAPIHKEDDTQNLESTLLCEKLILNSARVREHACMAVLFRAQSILGRIDMSADTLMKRSIAKTSNASNLFLLVKTILGNMHAYRLLIKEGRISVLCELIRNTGCWASMRTPSLIVVNCAKDSREFKDLYKAVVQYEIACIRECTAMTKLFYSNDIVAQFLEDDDMAVEAILKKSFLKVQICLLRHDSETDDRIFKTLTQNEKDLIQVFHYESFYYARPSVVFPCFIQVLQIAAQDTDNPLKVICNLVTSNRLISLLKKSIEGIDPRIISDLLKNNFFDNADISVQELFKLVREEADNRQNLSGDADAFYALQYNENELLVLSQVIATFGWES
jgi:hypothetical protein